MNAWMVKQASLIKLKFSGLHFILIQFVNPVQTAKFVKVNRHGSREDNWEKNH